MANDQSQGFPYDEIKIDDAYIQQLDEAAERLKSLGLDYEASEILKVKSSIMNQQKPFLVNASNRVALKAQLIERQKVGHSASGYVPTGNLRKSIKPTITDDSTAQVRADAQTKDGFYYGNAVEFGTFKMQAEPFLGPAINESQDENEKDADEFLRKGVEDE